jgi:hypothetical protein
MLFKNSVRTSKRTPHFTITKINWLTLFKFKGVVWWPVFDFQTQAWTSSVANKCVLTLGSTQLLIRLVLGSFSLGSFWRIVKNTWSFTSTPHTPACCGATSQRQFLGTDDSDWPLNETADKTLFAIRCTGRLWGLYLCMLKTNTSTTQSCDCTLCGLNNALVSKCWVHFKNRKRRIEITAVENEKKLFLFRQFPRTFF